MPRPKACPCGSGLEPEALQDGHGIFMCYACPQCRREKIAGFRLDIFERYDADEPIDDDQDGGWP